MDNLFYQPGIAEGVDFLDPEESRHCVRVLRKKSGDLISLTDGMGCSYSGRITDPSPVKCKFAVETIVRVPAKRYRIHIAVSPTKNADRLEWFVEKSVEIGIDEITLLNCKRTERTAIKTDRLLKLAISAMKQSGHVYLPQLRPLIS
jgi:16S rRNA (uracil1498-N3)-methyltransferase